VTLRADYVGGGFGAKALVQPHTRACIELARSAGAPVRLVLSREEELVVGGHRPAERMDGLLAVDADGQPAAMNLTALADSGVAVSNNIGLLWRIAYHQVPMHIEDFDVVTNGPPGKPFRGPGGPQAHWSLETLIDEAALELGEDPLALRKRWDPNPHRQRLYGWAEALPTWSGRGQVAADTGRYRRGVGLAGAVWFYLVQPSTECQLTVGPDGIVVSTACQDMGNGSRSVPAWTAAEAFGVTPQEITVRFGNSQYVTGPLSGGSRTTASLAPPVWEACQLAIADLVDFAEAHFGLQDAAAGAGGVQHAGGLLAWEEVLRSAPRRTYTTKRQRDEGGFFIPFEVGGFTVGMSIPGGVQVTELTVDTRLGRVVVDRVHLGLAVGRIRVPPLARSQVEGAVIQSTSYALYEERRLDPLTGVNLTHNLEDYRLLGIGDTPSIDVHFDETPWEHVPSKGVGLSELATIPGLASIANAVHHATGWRPETMPLSMDRVLAGVTT